VLTNQSLSSSICFCVLYPRYELRIVGGPIERCAGTAAGAPAAGDLAADDPSAGDLAAGAPAAGDLAAGDLAADDPSAGDLAAGEVERGAAGGFGAASGFVGAGGSVRAGGFVAVPVTRLTKLVSRIGKLGRCCFDSAIVNFVVSFFNSSCTLFAGT
jgi:hypothetical protein